MPILESIDKNYHLKTDASAYVMLTQQKPDQGTKVIEMKYYRRDSDDSFLIVMTAPENEKGNGYFRVGDNFWMYRINTRTFQHINRDESIGGTDAKSADFEKRKLTELYEPASRRQRRRDHIGRDARAGPGQQVRGKGEGQRRRLPEKDLLWTRRDNNLELNEESYSLVREL